MKQTAVEWLFLQMENLITKAEITNMDGNDFIIAKVKLLQEAKQMESKKHIGWNKFLETEKTLGISNIKTIERIQWYYNQYF